MRYLLALALVACGGSDKEGDGDTAGSDATLTEDEELLAELDGMIDGYASWNQFNADVEVGGSIHGEYIQMWWNDDAYDRVQNGGGADMPAGAVIVKQGYNDEAGTDLNNLTVMWKVDEEYGWFWASYDADGTNLQAGKPNGCIDCHAAAAQDSVFTQTW